MTAASLAMTGLDGPPQRGYRHCLGHFATGVTVVSYDHPEGPRGLTVNSFTSVSLDPALILVCVDRRSRAADGLCGTGFAVNVLRADQHAIAAFVAGMADSHPAGGWLREDGVPCLDDCMARLLCRPWASHDAGDHRLVIGEVTAYGAVAAAPLCFFRGQFVALEAAAP